MEKSKRKLKKIKTEHIIKPLKIKNKEKLLKSSLEKREKGHTAKQ